jgi:hypothetical protein
VSTIRIPGGGPVTIISDSAIFLTIPGDGPITVEHADSGGPSGSGLLMETGDYLLLETGDYILLEA